jgi:hypothetical protein
MLKTERRKHPRIETDVTVEVYTSSLQTVDPDVAEICSVVNLSESGMRFRAVRRFSEKQLLRLTFLLPNSIIIIRTDARVIHYQRRGVKAVEIGVEFTNISNANRKLIKHLVEKKIGSEITG